MIRTLFMILTALPSAALALTIEFDPPTSRQNGDSLDPATEIAHYDLYCRAPAGSDESPGFPDTGYEIPGAASDGVHETTYEAVFGERGTYECVLTATDNDGLESDYSNVNEFTWPNPPASPTNVIVVE